jgi:hypothetical protein
MPTQPRARAASSPISRHQGPRIAENTPPSQPIVLGCVPCHRFDRSAYAGGDNFLTLSALRSHAIAAARTG